AHRDERVFSAGALQLAGRGQGDARAGGAERVADRDGAAIRVDPAVGEIDFEAAQAGQDLRRERLVDLDHVDVLQRQAGALQRLFRGRHRAEAHYARLDA